MIQTPYFISRFKQKKYPRDNAYNEKNALRKTPFSELRKNIALFFYIEYPMESNPVDLTIPNLRKRVDSSLYFFLTKVY